MSSFTMCDIRHIREQLKRLNMSLVFDYDGLVGTCLSICDITPSIYNLPLNMSSSNVSQRRICHDS